MALGALMNSLASVNSSLSGIGGAMSNLKNIAKTIGGALKDAVIAAKDKIVEKLGDLKDWMKDLLTPLQEKIAPIIANIREKVSGVISFLKEKGGLALDWLGKKWNSIMEGLGHVKNTYITPLWDSLMEKGGNAIATIRGLIEDIGTTLSRIWGDYVSPAINFVQRKIEWVLQKIADLKKKATDAIDSVKGWLGFGGGKEKVGTVTTSTGGIGASSTVVEGNTNTFNMTMDVSGVTDRTDKRALADEISTLVQQQMARDMGGTVQRGRYS
jgi:phage-related protein